MAGAWSSAEIVTVTYMHSALFIPAYDIANICGRTEAEIIECLLMHSCGDTEADADADVDVDVDVDADADGSGKCGRRADSDMPDSSGAGAGCCKQALYSGPGQGAEYKACFCDGRACHMRASTKAAGCGANDTTSESNTNTDVDTDTDTDTDIDTDMNTSRHLKNTIQGVVNITVNVVLLCAVVYILM